MSDIMMNSFRLFVAIDLPDGVKDQLNALQSGISGATWVKRGTFHLTLRFIGDGISAVGLEQIKAALGQIEASAFDLMLQGVGRFPPSDKKGARVLWVGVAPQPLLMRQLQPAVERAVVSVGLPADDKPFNGHITIARLKKPDKLTEEVPRWLAQYGDFRSEVIPVTAFTLYSSLLTPQGPRYTHEAVYSLR
jgi:2'-5' RNA ligase